MRCLALLLALLWVRGTAYAQAGQDYGLHRTRWNEVGHLFTIAEEAQVTLSTSESLNLLEQPTSRGLLLLYPHQGPDLAAILNFVERGGRVAWLDDFGASAPMWHQLGLTRHLPNPPLGVSLLPIPQEVSHPLLAHVSDLWVNHPVLLSATNAQTRLLPLEDGAAPSAGHLILEFTRGKGRLLIVGDPSLLINELTQAHHGNKQWAANLLRYLCTGQPCEVSLGLPRTEVLSLAYTQEAKRLSRQLERAISRLEQHLPASRQERLLTALCLFAVLATLWGLLRRWPRLSPSPHLAFVAKPSKAQLRQALVQSSQPDLAFSARPFLTQILRLSQHPQVRHILTQPSHTPEQDKEQASLRALLARADEATERLQHPYHSPWTREQLIALHDDLSALERLISRGPTHVPPR